MAGIVVVRPGETVTVVGAEADPNAPRPTHPIMLPGMPGWGVPPGARPSHPIALPGDPWWGGGGVVDPGYGIPIGPGVPGPGGPVDPGYSPPWAQVRPPVDPGYSPPWAQIPVEPPTEPPPVKPPDSGHWVWAWSPQLGRWVWVKVPGEGEAGPKTA